jgi:signal transduction histidine kinase
VICNLEVADPDLALPDAHATAVFRGIQESLTNVTKHAHASRVEVAIGQSNGMLTVRVSDNGAGFWTEGPRKPNSYGLLGLRERAALLGGDATISSTPGEGTQIEIRLPFDPRRPPS